MQIVATRGDWHLQCRGNHQYREHGDLQRYFGEFREYLFTQDNALDQLAARLDGCVALMCFERNPAECHRSIVAAALADRLGTKVTHLTVP